MTANTLGGIGYFYGTSIVDKSFSHEWDDEESFGQKSQGEPTLVEPRALLTATPSRSFFPRGFYWYIGFTTVGYIVVNIMTGMKAFTCSLWVPGIMI